MSKKEISTSILTNGSTFSNGIIIFPLSKFNYRFPFVVIQQTSDNFSEGVGGFVKIYKGVVEDETIVSVLRETFQSLGIPELRTEIEMLSQTKTWFL
ncbi:Protein kinase superfamily protein [Euphorbia peplus]|nr:Protein kinase superfamily protein [Euphorbia peplus]